MTQATPRLLLIDNYDSFTYNLVQAFLVLGAEVLVHRNDAISVEQARALQPSHRASRRGPVRRRTPACRWT
jgi:anthranilate/para-aminobenzoate synthase component II